ncbi:7165_t:CDS:2, partial [Dentiscutata erythropus]
YMNSDEMIYWIENVWNCRARLSINPYNASDSESIIDLTLNDNNENDGGSNSLGEENRNDNNNENGSNE